MAFDPNVIAGTSGSLSKWILGAQQASLTRGDRLATLDLTAVKRGVPHLPIADAVTRAAVTLTINGASYLELDVHDPGWLVERSGLLDLDDNHRLNTVAVAIDGLWFRLAAARRRSADTLTLVFEDEAKWMLDQYTSHIHVSRDSRTRAEFIGALIYEAGQHRPRQLVYVSPQEGTRQLVKHPDLPTARPRDTGFDAGTTFKIKGDTADASQMREVATAMTVADQENVTDRVRLALLVAGIGESSFRAVMNAAGSGYGGVFQGDVTARYHYFKVGDTEGQARSFLKGGKGYQAGGAIKLASDNPNMSPGEIATKVEASGRRQASISTADRATTRSPRPSTSPRCGTRAPAARAPRSWPTSPTSSPAGCPARKRARGRPQPGWPRRSTGGSSRWAACCASSTTTGSSHARQRSSSTPAKATSGSAPTGCCRCRPTTTTTASSPPR
jgi:hypothetical protein